MLQEYIDRNKLTVDNVRELVDDYSLISYYIGELELNVSYSSPLRTDDTPSFSIYYGYGNRGSDNKIYFKDHVVGSGDVYKFLTIYFGASLRDVLVKINHDLELGFETGEVVKDLRKTIIKPRPLVRERPKIEIVSKMPTQAYLDYWKTLDISAATRELYNTKCLQAWQYHYSDRIVTKSVRDLTIGYSIGNRHKIYRPKSPRKKDKFRTDYLPNYVEGYLQLNWADTSRCTIAKATKECMFFREHFGENAIAGKSESTEISEEIMNTILNHFDQVDVWLDPDEAGEKMAKIYNAKYDVNIRRTPSFVDQKDATDIYTALGKDSLPLIHNILHGKL